MALRLPQRTLGDVDAAFGLGYAMAEDRLGDIYANVRTALGRASEAFGNRLPNGIVAGASRECQPASGASPRLTSRMR